MLDETGYRLDEEESAFYKAQTGIVSDAALKEHLVRVQAEALAVREYLLRSRNQCFPFVTRVCLLYSCRSLRVYSPLQIHQVGFVYRDLRYRYPGGMQ